MDDCFFFLRASFLKGPLLRSRFDLFGFRGPLLTHACKLLPLNVLHLSNNVLVFISSLYVWVSFSSAPTWPGPHVLRPSSEQPILNIWHFLLPPPISQWNNIQHRMSTQHYQSEEDILKTLQERGFWWAPLYLSPYFPTCCLFFFHH